MYQTLSLNSVPNANGGLLLQFFTSQISLFLKEAVVIMTEKNEMYTFDNKAYVADENDNGGPSKKVGGRFAQMTDEEKSSAKRGIMKNVVVISFSFMLLFTAFQSMANLQSSINKVSFQVIFPDQKLKGFERKLLEA